MNSLIPYEFDLICTAKPLSMNLMIWLLLTEFSRSLSDFTPLGLYLLYLQWRKNIKNTIFNLFLHQMLFHTL